MKFNDFVKCSVIMLIALLDGTSNIIGDVKIISGKGATAAQGALVCLAFARFKLILLVVVKLFLSES
jgi:hypothetical protein